MFEKARLRLTFYYMAIMAVILIVISVAMYLSLTQELRDDLREQLQTGEELERFAFVNTLHGARNTVIMADLLVLALVAGGSYILAGKTLHPIRQALDAQKRFMADASHELRTPLAVMKTESEVVLRNHQAQPGEFRNALASNLEEVNSMAGMVESLLSLSNADYHQDHAAHAAVSLSQLVEHVVGKLRPIADQKRISLSFIAGNGQSLIMGNAEALSRVAYNLLNNAIAYTNPGGKITAEIIELPESVGLRVSDTGVGISPADLPHIFKRFYKADKARGGHGGGAGLGLSIVKSIISNHGGEISVTSKLGQGSVFTATFPIHS